LALADDVSLNQLVVSVLAKEIGFRKGCKVGSLSISAGADPSTDQWRAIRTEIAVNESWRITSGTPNTPLNDIYIERLIEGLPNSLRVSSQGVSYENKVNEKDWN